MLILQNIKNYAKRMKFNINFGSATDGGKVKEHNTDAVIEFPIANGHVFVVCDGHNGVEYGGALAAKITTEEIKRYFQNRTYGNLANALPNAVSYANYCVYNQSLKETRYNGIGSTVAILIVQNDEAYYASAGNSRIYFCKGGEIARITRDHVENNEVTVLVGREKNIKFSVCKNPIQLEGDEKFLVCSDGLTSQLSDEDIFKVLNDNDMSAEFKTAQLIEKANAAGGTDNVSVQVVDFSEMTKKEPRVSIWKSVAIISSLLLVIIGIFEIYKYKVNDGEVKKVKSEPKKTEIAVVAKQESQVSNQVVVETPKAKEIKQPEQSAPKSANPSEETIYLHRVEKGQNLFRIGLRYNVSLNTLEKINGDVASRLTIGSKLKIPVKAVHKVEPGESLQSIAAGYGSNEVLIIKANQLAEGQPLLAGQVIVIPLSKK